MRREDLVRDTLEGARDALTQTDGRTVAAVLGIISAALVAAAVGGAAMMTRAGEAIEAGRHSLGVIGIQLRDVVDIDGSLTAALEPRLRKIVNEQNSRFEGLSVRYRAPYGSLSGIKRLNPETGRPENEGSSVAVRDDDPLVTPGLGLPPDAKAPFVRKSGDEHCWRLAMMVAHKTLVEGHGIAEAEADRMVAGNIDLQPLHFAVDNIAGVEDTTGDIRVPKPFAVVPALVIDAEGKRIADYTFSLDAALITASNRGIWSPLALAAMRSDTTTPCEEEKTLIRFSESQGKASEPRRWTGFPERSKAERVDFEVWPNADGYDSPALERPDLTQDALADLRIRDYLVWVRDFTELEAFSAAEERLIRFAKEYADEDSWLERGTVFVEILERSTLYENLVLQRLGRHAVFASAIGGVLIVFTIAVAFGLAHVHRHRHAIALLRSQGATRWLVTVRYGSEIGIVAGGAAVAGASTSAVLLLVAAAVGVTLEIAPGILVVAAIAVPAALTAFATAGGLIPAMGAAHASPAEVLRNG